MNTNSMRRSSNGFTLIELLIVIVIIGILASIAIPKYAATKEKTYITRMINDLRNLETSQEAYFTDYATYYNGPLPGPGFVFSPTSGVTLVINEATPRGWSATASTIGTLRQCMIFIAAASPVGPATVDGKAACT